MGEMMSGFAGAAGQNLRLAARGSSWITGAVLVVAFFFCSNGLGAVGFSRMFPLLAVVLLFQALAFHATASASSRATTHRSMTTGLQVAAGSALWLGPWMVWVLPQPVGEFPLSAIGAPTPLAATLFVFGCLIATPALLIVATHSRRWTEIAKPAHWSRLFRGRSTDLMTVYTMQTGGLVLAVAFLSPVVTLAARIDTAAGLAASALAACLVLGFWVALAGRLGGAFHEERMLADQPAAVPRFDDDLAVASADVVTEDDKDFDEHRIDEGSDAGVEEPSTEREIRVFVDERLIDTKPQASAEDASSETVSRAVQPPADDPAPEPTPHLKHPTFPATRVEYERPTPAGAKRKTPLLDAERRVEEAMKRFRLDPSYTLTHLTELNERFAPNPHVLQALAICLHRTGHDEDALATARQAFPLCFDHGMGSLAAKLFHEMRGQLNKLKLEREDILLVADVLSRADELPTAAKAYSLVIHGDPTEPRAVTGLLGVADRILKHKKKPDSAIKVYRFLLEHCEDPGTTELVRHAMARCSEAVEAGQPTT